MIVSKDDPILLLKAGCYLFLMLVALPGSVIVQYMQSPLQMTSGDVTAPCSPSRTPLLTLLHAC